MQAILGLCLGSLLHIVLRILKMPRSKLATDLIEYIDKFSDAKNRAEGLEVVKQYADHQWSVVLGIF